jgi:hypothetical protein
MYYFDHDVSSDMYGWFTKYDLYGAIVSEWAVGSSGSAGYNYATIAISPPEVINNDDYSYVLNWRPYAASTNDMLCGFKLFYTVYSFNLMPLVIRH